MKTAAIVVVGGGVMGASVAYHLAALGIRDVVVLDRGPAPGAGSTGRATGGFRAQYATAINVRLSLLSRAKLRRFEEETGVDPGYQPVGYLWIAETEAQLAALAEGRRVQHTEGLHEAVEISVDEVLRLNPAVVPDGILGGAFCPTDGYIRPMRILEGYVSAGTRLGVRFEWNVEVTDLPRGGDGRVREVTTTGDAYACDVVVNAAGAWAAPLAALAGVTLPVTPLRRQVALTEPFDGLPASMPMTIFAGDGFHLRVRDGRVLLLCPTPGVADRPFDTSVDDAFLDSVTSMAHQRLPVLRGARLDRPGSWAGLYEMSPDKHALLGFDASGPCPNLAFLNGSSGHGVMHAPALGHLLAEIVAGRPTSLDVSPLRPSRFAEGASNPVSELL